MRSHTTYLARLWMQWPLVLGLPLAAVTQNLGAQATAPDERASLNDEGQATTGEKIRAAAETVKTALRCELDGQNDERGELLRGALEMAPYCSHARWHSGYVQEDENWVRYDQLVEQGENDASLREYRRQRAKAPEGVQGQLTLAKWCAQNGLEEQARAHATAALQIEPDNAEARMRLGHQRIGGAWFTPEQIAEAKKMHRKRVAGWKKWAPQIEPLCRRLDDADENQRERARSILCNIDDPAAIPVMEAKLANRSEPAALAMVDALDQMATNEASIALARQAVFSTNDSVQDKAIGCLKNRDWESYVPALLSVMSTPIIAEAELYTTPTGRLMYRQTFSREGQHWGEKVVRESDNLGNARPANRPGARPRVERPQAKQDLDTLKRGADWAVGQKNTAIEEANKGICRVLGKITGKDLEPTPKVWWEWWNDYNEVYLKGGKPVIERRETGVITPPPPPRMDCLVAGTPVWTDAGLVPIEQTRVGDRVLSQDPDTGRLEYKPVLRTTERPQDQVVRIVFQGGLLQCSGGHPLWVSGKGWVKARDLQEGTFLHSAEGAVEVVSVYPAGTEETFNLIVADHHTYFITEAAILNHDNTIRRLTNAIVPGLMSH